MLRRIIINITEQFVRKTKNPSFSFDKNLTSQMIFNLLKAQVAQRLRGLKLLLSGRLPSGLQLGVGVKLNNIQNIKLGRGVRMGDYVLLDGLGVEKISLGDGCSIASYSRLVISTSYSNIGKHISLGSNVAIGEFSYIGGAGGVTIGEGTIVGQYLSMHPENHIFSSPDTPIRLQGVTRQGIRVGKNVWIGAKVTILDGVNIGDNSVVCAGATVTAGNYPSGSVLGGCPAKILKER